MPTRTTVALLAGSLLLAFSTPAIAKKSRKYKRHSATTVTGLAAMHSLQRVRGKICFANHYHYGSGSSQKSKALALRAAKYAWADFVVAEYGSAWARFSRAGSKGTKCHKNGTGFQCSVEARPCKR